MAQRVTYIRRLSYNTKSNKTRQVKTPGAVLKVHYLKKRVSKTICGDCHIQLPGLPLLNHYQLKNQPKNKKSVSRAYGGSRCANCVRNRIIRAFLIEEQKIVKKVLKDQEVVVKVDKKKESKVKSKGDVKK